MRRYDVTVVTVRHHDVTPTEASHLDERRHHCRLSAAGSTDEADDGVALDRRVVAVVVL